MPNADRRIGRNCTVQQTAQRVRYFERRMAASVFTFLTAIACLFAQPAATPARAEPSATLSVSSGDKPHFTLPDSNGLNVELSAQRGRPVLVHFFATWCEPCRDELPALKRLVERAGPQGISVLAISVAEVDLRVRRFLETTPVNFPVLLDRDRAIAKAWRVDTLPTTYVLDATLTPRLLVESDFAWDTIQIDELTQRLSKVAPGNGGATTPSTTMPTHTGG